MANRSASPVVPGRATLSPGRPLCSGEQRLWHHFEMQPRTAIGMGVADSLIEFHADAGFLRRDDAAVLPFDLFLQQRRVESVPLLERLQDQEVRQCCSKLNVGGSD